MSSFQDLGVFFVHNNPKAKTKRIYAHARERARFMPHARNSFGLLSQGYCEQKTLNLELLYS